ncbi:MAG: PAS domain S-box protein, partial [Spirochaetaceae bacterium]|nr:PAS domain S-box protein [Spirochaetaceae bacterium]
WSASRTFYSGLGYDPIVGLVDRASWMERSLPEDLQVIRAAERDIRGGKCESAEYEARMLHADGGYRWQRVSCYVVERGSDGAAIRVLGIRKNINDRKVAEEALRASEKRLRGLFEDSPVSLWEEDFSAVRERIDAVRASEARDWAAFFAPRERVIEFASLVKVLDVNRATMKLLECSDKKEALLALDFFFDDEAIEVFRSELVALASGRLSFETESMLNTIAGRRVFLQLKLIVLPGHDDTWSRVIVAMVDLSERKAAEKALHESEAKYRGLVEQSSEGIVLVDEAGIVVDCNPVFERLAECERSRLVGRPADCLELRFLSPDAREGESGFATVLARMKSQSDGAPRAETFETTVAYDGGRERTLEHTVFPIRLGSKLLVCVFLRDVTERRAAARALMASLQEKELLLTEIHHRVNNNLQIICSFVDLQLEGKDESAAERAPLRDMESRVRAMSFVHDIMYRSDDFTSIDFPNYARRLVEYLLEAYRADPCGPRIDLAMEPIRLSITQAIPCGLIVNELIISALKRGFLADRIGSIRIELSRAGPDRVSLAVSDDRPFLREERESAPGEMGWDLVEGLARQLHGTSDREGVGGTLVRVVFPA